MHFWIQPIIMVKENKEKIVFVTKSGTYYLNVMPFRLKNASAIYQQPVNKIFKQQMGRNVEVYVDDMLVKSTKVNHHIHDLQETFDVLRRYEMKLNPQKCVFGA